MPTITILSDRTLTARKVYTCDLTGKVIATGERYRRIVQVVDGTLETIRLA